MSNKIVGSVETKIDVINIYPELEDVVITPTKKEQNLLSNKYGYKNIKVKEIQGENITIIPSTKEQVFEGIYDKVKVVPIDSKEINITPSQQTQTYEGMYKKINVAAIEGENLIVTPTTKEQVLEGVYTNVSINPIEGETLEVAPTTEAQKFEGVYTNVNVNPITGDTLNVTPTSEKQNYKGVYTEVNVDEITGDTLNVTPSTEEQKHEGVYTTVNVEPIQPQELVVTPSNEDQTQQGVFTSVTIAGEPNYLAENIAKGKSMWGLEGTFEGGGSHNAVIEITTDNGTFDIKPHIKEIVNLDLSKITQTNGFQGAFKQFENLKKVTFSGSTSHIKSFYQTFQGCKNLETVSEIDGTNCTSFCDAFYNCQKLKRVSIKNTSKNTSCYEMFIQAYLLEEGPEMDTTNVTNMAYMFNTCKAIHTVPQYQAGKVKQIQYMFSNATKLQNLGGFVDLGKAYTTQKANYEQYTLTLSPCTLLTHDSLMNVINNLYDLNLTYDVANGGTLYSQILNLGATNLAKLTANEIAIASNKGWAVI